MTAQLRVIAKQLRAFSYSYCHGCETIAEAKAYRETFAEREGMLIWPNFIAYNPATGDNEEFPAVAYALGLRALIDNEQGWHKSLSNVPVKNVLGISKDVFWALQAEDSDANELNAHEITTLIKRDGFRFWGNRVTDKENLFSRCTREPRRSGGQYRRSAVHHSGHPADPGERERRGERHQRQTTGAGHGGQADWRGDWYDVVDNPVTGIRQGKAIVRYSYSPVPPLEDLTMIQTFTDQYYEPAFASLGVNSGYSKNSDCLPSLLTAKTSSGRVPSVTLPKLTRKTEDYQGGGMVGSVADLGWIPALDASMIVGGVVEELI